MEKLPRGKWGREIHQTEGAASALAQGCEQTSWFWVAGRLKRVQHIREWKDPNQKGSWGSPSRPLWCHVEPLKGFKGGECHGQVGFLEHLSGSVGDG